MSYLTLPFVEIEVRLGTQTQTKFDSCVDKRYFNEILESLNKGTWNSIILTDTVEYVKDQLKLIVNGAKEILRSKENVLTKTIQLDFSPFDIRFSINQEFNLNSGIKTFSKINCVTRNKKRTSFISSDYRYDLTIVKETINKIVKEKYEIEIEIIVNENTLEWDNKYINDFIECKIYDLINIVEPLEREKFKIKII